MSNKSRAQNLLSRILSYKIDKSRCLIITSNEDFIEHKTYSKHVPDILFGAFSSAVDDAGPGGLVIS